MEMMDRILFREDEEAAAVLAGKLQEEGISILTGKKAIRFEEKEGKVYGTLQDKDGEREEISAERVLVAVGRAPNLAGLSLDKAGIELTKEGIRVNAYLQTSNKNVFACGDVVGPYRFSHVAAYQASICVRNALFRRLAWQKVDYQNVAWATFTEPEIAHLGLTEKEAKERYGSIKVYRTPYANADRAVTDIEKDGLVKIITDRKGYILGAHIVGSQAGEIIQGLLVAKSLKAPLSRLAQVLFIYPTLSELIKKTAAQPLVEKLDNPFIKLILKIMKKI